MLINKFVRYSSALVSTPIIPKMTSNTQDGFTVSSNAVDALYPPYYAFDQNDTTHWYYYNGNGHTVVSTPWWLKVELPSIMDVTRLTASFEYLTSALSGKLEGKVQYSTDGTIWINVVDSAFSIQTGSGVSSIDITFGLTVTAKYIRLYFTSVPQYSSANLAAVYSMQIYELTPGQNRLYFWQNGSIPGRIDSAGFNFVQVVTGGGYSYQGTCSMTLAPSIVLTSTPGGNRVYSAVYSFLPLPDVTGYRKLCAKITSNVVGYAGDDYFGNFLFASASLSAPLYDYANSRWNVDAITRISGTGLVELDISALSGQAYLCFLVSALSQPNTLAFSELYLEV